MRSKKTWTLAIVVLAIAVIAGLRTAAVLHQKAVDSVAARAKGDAQAKVQIIEFMDFQCPACAAGSQVLKEYLDKYPKDIRLQIKYFPLIRNHRHAMQSALYSECAARQGKFWEFHELLMPSQSQWSPLLSADASFMDMARQSGEDMGKLNACLVSEDAAKAVNDDHTLGQSLGVQSTPTYFLNNKMLVGVKALKDELEVYFPPS